MRPIAMALGALAVLFAAGCETTPETACDIREESEALAAIQATLTGKTTRADYNAALLTAYPQLTAINERTSKGMPGVAAGEQIACYVIAAEAAEMQSFLPASERGSVAPASSAPPFQLAKAAADAALALCPADEPERCAVARMISGTAVSNDAYSAISAIAANEASTDTVDGWTMADTRMDSFGVSASDWTELVTEASSGGAISREDAMGYITPLACGVFADAGAIRGRATAEENADAAEAFAVSYLAAMDEIAEELGLALPEAADQACENTPESVACREAGAGAVLAMCQAYWGFSGN